ncbi:MAG: sodium:solute symporter family protein [Desulfurococcaceae archaeon]
MRVEFVAVMSIYASIGTLLALLSRRYFTGTFRDYYTASGRVGGLISFGTYAATTYSAFMMIGLVGLTHATGVGAYGFELVYLASTMVLLATVGYNIWKLSKGRSWISPAQMIGDLYQSRALALATTGVYLFAMIPYLAAQVLGLKAIFHYGGLGEHEALLVSTVLIYLWIFVAGMWSVALTDLYQGLIMLFSGLAYLAWVVFFAGSLGVSVHEIFALVSEKGYLGITEFWSLPVFLAYTIPWAFFAITNPQVVIRLYLPKDYKAYRRSTVFFFFYGFLYTLIVVLVGLFAAGLTLKNGIPADVTRDRLTPYLLSLMNPWLGSLVAVSIIAAAVSTSNSIVLAVSGSVVSSMNIRERLVIARLIDLVLVSAAGVVAYFNPGFIVEMSVLTSVILLPLAPITIVGVYWSTRISRLTKVTGLASLIVGALFASACAVVLGPRRTFVGVIWGMPISAWTLLISTTILLAGYAVDIARTLKQ